MLDSHDAFPSESNLESIASWASLDRAVEIGQNLLSAEVAEYLFEDSYNLGSWKSVARCSNKLCI